MVNEPMQSSRIALAEGPGAGPGAAPGGPTPPPGGGGNKDEDDLQRRLDMLRRD